MEEMINELVASETLSETSEDKTDPSFEQSLQENKSSSQEEVDFV